MPYSQNINIQEESDFKKILDLFLKNYKLFAFSMVIIFAVAFFINRYSTPKYSITASILIKEDSERPQSNINDYLNSSLFGRDQNFQNELWVIKSTPIIEKAIKNLDLIVSYYSKGKFNYYEQYEGAPFKVSFMTDHAQPIFVRFKISFLNDTCFQLKAESKMAYFYNFKNEEVTHQKDNWIFVQNSKFGELIETPDLAFIIEPTDTALKVFDSGDLEYAFTFSTIASLGRSIEDNLDFNIVDRLATVIQISFKCESVSKGINILNELMNVYSNQKLERKNHIATITIDYIEKQLNEISDSLTLTEDNLESFRSSRQLLNITDQSTEVYSQYREMLNQLAEKVSMKRYYEYISELLMTDNFSNIMLPTAIGIPDQLLNDLMSQLITTQAQRENLIQNNQERNPLVQKLSIQIENLKKTITENISSASRINNISIDEMEKRVRKIEAEISRLPVTQRQLGNIERKYRLNESIYNYLMEKHAEAKITKASNLPDDIVVEPAMGAGRISPNTRRNYFIAFFLGLALPFSFIMMKSALNTRIESQNEIESLTKEPVLGKILHSRHKTRNVMFEFPKSNIAESFRALRTNLDFYVRGGHKKVIMITSCLENEGKSFVALNLAMSYAQLGRRTILVDFDLRKPKSYFEENTEPKEGLSSFMINKIGLIDIIRKSSHENLDYIDAGILPPNPVELIALEKTEELITTLKKDYDLIVLDTTPLAQVTDAYLLINHAEVKIIITRQNYTFKKVFSLIMKDLQQKNVGNICIVLNDNRVFYEQYGYGYGYYNKEKKKWSKMKRRVGVHIEKNNT
jgi:tyrosine-protein kinase Etk/Wzc